MTRQSADDLAYTGVVLSREGNPFEVALQANPTYEAFQIFRGKR